LYAIYFDGDILYLESIDVYFLKEVPLYPCSITFVKIAPNPSLRKVPDPQNFNSTFVDKVASLTENTLLVNS